MSKYFICCLFESLYFIWR